MKTKEQNRGLLRLLAVLLAMAVAAILVMGLCGCGGESEETADYNERNNAFGDSYVNLEEELDYNYVLNNNTMKFHYPDCSSADEIKEKNKEYYNGTRDEIIEMGYDPCKRCCP